MNGEIWKDVEGWSGFYKVSDHGRVFSVRRGIYLKEIKCPEGYKGVNLCCAPLCKFVRIHRIVARCFLESGSVKQSQVNHIDGDKTNNHYTNLEWVTDQENKRHAFDIGLIYRKGAKNPNSKLTENDVIEIRSLKKSGFSGRKLADMFGVTRDSIYKIHNGVSWKHVSTGD